MMETLLENSLVESGFETDVNEIPVPELELEPVPVPELEPVPALEPVPELEPAPALEPAPLPVPDLNNPEQHREPDQIRNKQTEVLKGRELILCLRNVGTYLNSRTTITLNEQVLREIATGVVSKPLKRRPGRPRLKQSLPTEKDSLQPVKQGIPSSSNKESSEMETLDKDPSVKEKNEKNEETSQVVELPQQSRPLTQEHVKVSRSGRIIIPKRFLSPEVAKKRKYAARQQLIAQSPAPAKTKRRKENPSNQTNSKKGVPKDNANHEEKSREPDLPVLQPYVESEEPELIDLVSPEKHPPEPKVVETNLPQPHDTNTNGEDPPDPIQELIDDPISVTEGESPHDESDSNGRGEEFHSDPAFPITTNEIVLEKDEPNPNIIPRNLLSEFDLCPSDRHLRDRTPSWHSSDSSSGSSDESISSFGSLGDYIRDMDDSSSSSSGSPTKPFDTIDLDEPPEPRPCSSSSFRPVPPVSSPQLVDENKEIPGPMNESTKEEEDDDDDSDGEWEDDDPPYTPMLLFNDMPELVVGQFYLTSQEGEPMGFKRYTESGKFEPITLDMMVSVVSTAFDNLEKGIVTEMPNTDAEPVEIQEGRED